MNEIFGSNSKKEGMFNRDFIAEGIRNLLNRNIIFFDIIDDIQKPFI